MYLVQGRLNGAKDPGLAMRLVTRCDSSLSQNRSVRLILPLLMCRLLGGLLHPTEGTIYIPPQLEVLVVPPEPVLIAGWLLRADCAAQLAVSSILAHLLSVLTGSLWENLTLGNSTTPEAYVWELVRQPCACLVCARACSYQLPHFCWLHGMPHLACLALQVRMPTGIRDGPVSVLRHEAAECCPSTAFG
jgi:hypothetical protein